MTWLFERELFAPVAKLTAQGSFSVITDHLGTPLALYDGRGRPTWQAQLDSYGAVREGKGKAQDCPFRYQGQYKDVETGLYYNRFRYYDPEAGTCISQDPIRVAGGTKLYSYVRDPTSWVDVLGWMLWPNPTRQGHHLYTKTRQKEYQGSSILLARKRLRIFSMSPILPVLMKPSMQPKDRTLAQGKAPGRELLQAYYTRHEVGCESRI